jgi:hypothetical protein
VGRNGKKKKKHFLAPMQVMGVETPQNLCLIKNFEEDFFSFSFILLFIILIISSSGV